MAIGESSNKALFEADMRNSWDDCNMIEEEDQIVMVREDIKGFKNLKYQMHTINCQEKGTCFHF